MKFAKGVLYVVLEDDTITDLFYPTEDVPKDYQRFVAENLATVVNGKAEPSFGAYIETRKHKTETGLGEYITFRKATNSDIKEILENWGPDAVYDVTEWLEAVLEYNDLLEEKEKNRLKKLAKKYM